MNKVSLSILGSFVIAASAHSTNTLETYVLNCQERNGDKVFITDAKINAKTAFYKKTSIATLAFPKLGKYRVNENPDVIMKILQEQVKFPTIEDVSLSIQTDDTYSLVKMENVYNVHFGRISTTITFSGSLTQSEGDVPDGVKEYQATCELTHY